MGRKPKTARVPRTRAGGEWTEAAFWGFVRSLLRKGSLLWPPRKQALLAARRPYSGPNKRQKFEVRCAACGGWFAQKVMEVDHITPCGKLTSFADIGEFTQRLFCEAEGFRALCKPCHKKRKA